MKQEGTFYLISPVQRRGAVVFGAFDSDSGSAAFADFKGERSAPHFTRFEVAGGSRFPDVALCDPIPLVLGSDRFVDCFDSAGITGWETYPVTIEGNKKGMSGEYRGLRILGRCGPIDESRVRTEIRATEAGNGRYVTHVGLYFRAGTWDGSDLFVPSDTSA